MLEGLVGLLVVLGLLERVRVEQVLLVSPLLSPLLRGRLESLKGKLDLGDGLLVVVPDERTLGLANVL